MGMVAVVVFDGHGGGCLVVPVAGVVLAQNCLWSNGCCIGSSTVR